MSSEPPAPAQEEAPEASSSPPKESARGGGAAAGGLETNTLWVGNLHQQASEADVMAAFAPHGALDCVIARAGAGARGYAFVLFHRSAEARAALEALQGAKIKGAAIRNEFARPARAVRNLWVGGIDPSIPKGELEEEFQKFGKIEGVAFSHDQTAAYIDFEKLEDAISAHRALNGTVLGGKELCVDFQRSRGRTEWSEVSNLNGKVSMPPGEMRVGSAKGSTGLRMREAQPTNVLWVGFPGLYKINEEMLRRAMAAHGMVTNIKVFPARQYAFVEFATIKEASNAKNLLDGRLFNDSRIQILFSNSELAPNKLDNPTQVVGFPRSEMYYNDGHLDYSGPGLGSHGTLQGYDPRRGRSRHGDYGGGSVTGGILPSPDSGTFLAGRSAHDTSDPREAKRMRLDAGADPYDVRAGSEGLYPVGYSHGGVAARAERSSSPAIRIQGTVHRTSFLEHFWRGSIAKGGSPVCRARCLPIRKGTEIPLPDIVNCSARTGLDMLAKHYGDASGFDIVFFLPDSEDDFVSYTEFLRYLGSKGRAGVVKVDAGTTLFLVPPSDFLTNVLQVDGPERLYGVVLHIPQMATAAVQRPQLTGPEPQPYYNEKETVFTSQRNYSIDSQLQDADYRGSLHEESLHRLGQVPVRARGVDEGQAVQPILGTLPANQTAGPQVHTSLRPDIMSTIAKLMPSNIMQSSALGTGQVPLGPTDRPMASLMHDASTLSKVWKPENQAMASTSSFEHMGNLQQPGQQFSKQVPVAHLTNYGNMVNAQEHSAHTAYNPEITLNLPPAPAPPPPTLPPTSAILSSMSGHSLTTHMSQQQYQPEQYYMSQSSYGPLATASHSNQHVSNANLPVPPPLQVNSASLPANNQMGNLSQLQLASALPTDRVIPDFSSQVQQQQNVASGAAQAPDEADKNKKYQATLQFAHNLLLQLQRGSGNQP